MSLNRASFAKAASAGSVMSSTSTNSAAQAAAKPCAPFVGQREKPGTTLRQGCCSPP